MLTAMDKGIEAAKCATPPSGTYQGVDLKTLPKYICFKAAMLKEKMTLKYVLIIHTLFFILLFCTSRFEIHSLESKLREKEYILAPGVMDFTPASPQSVSDAYVVNAAMSFASLFGNVNATNIDEQFKRLSEFMSPELRIQFLTETNEWREIVKNENISEILRVNERELVSSEEGYYQFTALTRRERYSNNESLGHADEAIHMTLKLIPPVKGKEWYLQIESLKRSSITDFQNHETKQYQDQRGGK